jgi:hypothetical protein
MSHLYMENYTFLILFVELRGIETCVVLVGIDDTEIFLSLFETILFLHNLNTFALQIKIINM